ncbi:MAG: hypothetical protein AAF734_05470 [Bacteroidota bacterium]
MILTPYRFKYFLSTFLVAVLLLSACNNDDDTTEEVNLADSIRTTGFVIVGVTESGSSLVKYVEALPTTSIDLSDGIDFANFIPNSVYEGALFLARPDNAAGFAKYVVNANGELEERGIIPVTDASSFRIDVRDAEVGVLHDRATPNQITVFNPTTFQVTNTIDMSEGFVPGEVNQRYQRFIFRGDDVFMPIRGNTDTQGGFSSFVLHQANLRTNTFVGDTQRDGNGISVITTTNNFGQNLLDDQGDLYINDSGSNDGAGIAGRVNKIPAGSNEIDESYVFEPSVQLNPDNNYLPAFNTFSLVGGSKAIAKVNTATPQEAIDIVEAAGGTINLSPEQRSQVFAILAREETASWCELDLDARTATSLTGVPAVGIFGFASTFKVSNEVYMYVYRETSGENAFYRWNPTTGEVSKAFDVIGAEIQGIYNLSNNN